MRISRLTLLLLSVLKIWAQSPVIAPHGILNAGSYTSPGLPGGSIARGSVFTIFGQNLGPVGLAQQPSLPLSTSLAGISIKVAQGTTSVDAIPVAVVAGQINAIMPSNAPLGLVSVQVTNNGTKSNPSPLTVVNASFGAYAIAGGQGPGIVQNFNSQTDQPINSPFQAAHPGQIVILWGTGLGPVTGPDNNTPTPGDLPTKVEVFVGGVAVTDKRYSGRSSYAGTDEVIFAVPANAPLGCWVPVQVRTEGTAVSKAITMAITAVGSTCSEPTNAVGQRLVSGGKNLGVVGLTRMLKRVSSRAPLDETVDTATVSLRQENTGSFPFNPLLSLPPAGSCTVYNSAGDLLNGDSLPGTAPVKYLNGGASFTILGRAVAAVQEPLPLTTIGSKVPVGTTSSLVLNPGNASVQSSGGGDVTGFSLSVPIPAALTWTNRDQITKVDRTKPLAINWSGAPSGSSVVILGINADQPSNSSTVFVCVAGTAGSSFTIPDYVLQAIPPSRKWPFRSAEAMFVGALPLASPTIFSATGLDLGAAFPVVVSAKSVFFQ